MRTLRLIVFAAGALLPMAADAEFQISGYGGANTANNSDVTLNVAAGVGHLRCRLVR